MGAFSTDTVGIIVIASNGVIVAEAIVACGRCVDNLAAAFFDQVEADEGAAPSLSSACHWWLRSVLDHHHPLPLFATILPICLLQVFVDCCAEWRTRLLSPLAPVICGCRHCCCALLSVVLASSCNRSSLLITINTISPSICLHCLLIVVSSLP